MNRTNNRLNKIPKFKNEDEERDFWTNADSSDYFNFNNPIKAYFPNLKHSTETISLRLPKPLLDKIKILANQKDVPYQSLIKIILDKGITDALYPEIIYDKPIPKKSK
ncbi:MAG TPA: BrnA antitoxin family protein [Ignavibacteria bacterium]|nr:BrnA antitoxin family protein [Ignavibacteria bacterium]